MGSNVPGHSGNMQTYPGVLVNCVTVPALLFNKPCSLHLTAKMIISSSEMKVNPDNHWCFGPPHEASALSFSKMQDGNVNHDPFENWNDINWLIVEVRVFKLQTQIYNLSKNGKKEASCAQRWKCGIVKDYSRRTTMPNYFQ